MEQFRTRRMNFGQHWRTPDIEEVDYEAVVPGLFVRPWLDGWLVEYRADREQFPDPDDAVEQLLRKRLWPNAATILADPELAIPVVKDFGVEILSEWFTDGIVPGVEQFVLNTIVRTDVRDGSPVFFGKARTPREDVQYQDW